jgi:hypothetical protein
MKSQTSRQAVGYIRVPKQNEKGVSLHSQSRKDPRDGVRA